MFDEWLLFMSCYFVEQGWAWLGRGFSNDVKYDDENEKCMKDSVVIMLADVAIRRRRLRRDARKMVS